MPLGNLTLFLRCIIIVYFLQRCFTPCNILAQGSIISSKLLKPADTRNYTIKNPRTFMVWFLLH